MRRIRVLSIGIAILLLTTVISGSACAGAKHTTSVCCIGDSLTCGWPETCTTYPQALQMLLDSSHQHDNWMVVNDGIGGNTTGQMLARFQTDVIDQEPNVVVIWGGINDVLFQSTPVPTIECNLQCMYTQAHMAGITVVALYISPFKGYPLWTASQQATVDAVNLWIGVTATDVDYRINIYAQLEDPGRPDYLLPDYDADGTHLTTAGYAIVAMAAYDALD